MEKRVEGKNHNLNILGVRVDDLSKNALIDNILTAAAQKRKVLITYVNVHAVNLTFDDDWFRNFLNSSDVVFCDGFGVKLAASILSGKRIERFTPPDWLPELAGRASEQGFSFFLLGSRPGIAGKAAEKLAESAHDFRLAGVNHGYFGKDRENRENQELISRINQAKPDILLVGFGMPIQEKWIEENRQDLNVSVVMTVGAAFDYLAGEVRRVPQWATGNGLEWLGRLLVEPRRLWRRYIIGNPVFFWRIYLQKIGWMKPADISK
jgi:N-acetylglucosaminyldiphosphoundecaprenol N-acetyl-beta-D-mannosaminyltransferase